MRWPLTFGAERIDCIERLSTVTGYAPLDLMRAVRGYSIHELQALLHTISHPASRGTLERLVELRRTRD